MEQIRLMEVVVVRADYYKELTYLSQPEQRILLLLGAAGRITEHQIMDQMAEIRLFLELRPLQLLHRQEAVVVEAEHPETQVQVVVPVVVVLTLQAQVVQEIRLQLLQAKDITVLPEIAVQVNPAVEVEQEVLEATLLEARPGGLEQHHQSLDLLLLTQVVVVEQEVPDRSPVQTVDQGVAVKVVEHHKYLLLEQ